MNTETLTVTWARRLGQVRADLLWISDRWPDLYQSRIPGTARPRPVGHAATDARRRRDELVRTERAERGDSVLGGSKAPMDLDVLDVLTELLTTADELAERIAETAGVDVLAPPTTAYDYPALGLYLAHVGEHLAAAAEIDHEALDDAQHTVRRMRARLEGALGEIVDGHRLSVMCAWCRGVTSEAPAGGERTLVVRLVANALVIVCTSDVCSPPPADCGTWVYGRPAWPEHEWGWLNGRLEAVSKDGRMAS